MLTMEGQMMPDLVLKPVGIKLTHCNFEQIEFIKTRGVEGAYCIRGLFQHIVYLALGIPETCNDAS